MTEGYAQYLPEFVRELREFQILAEVETPILEEEKTAKEILEKDQWIATATERGLRRRGLLLGIAREELESIETFRQRILFLWNHRKPYTYFHLLDWLEGLCGKENVEIQLYLEEYYLKIVLQLRKKHLQEEVRKTVRKMIPANILLDVLLRYNTYGDLKPKTHGEIKGRKVTYAALQEEDIVHWDGEY